MKRKFNLKTYWKRHLIFRHFVFFIALFGIWVWLFIGALLSPDRVTYKEELLATEMKFANKSGEIDLVNQTYSKETGIVLLEFETSDYTSSIDKGITPSNLEWQLLSKDPTTDLSMDIIPLTDNRITVVIKGVPDKFDVLGVRVTNNTVLDSNLDLNIEDYGQEQSILRRNKNSNNVRETVEGEDRVQFLITTQSPELDEKPLEDLSREKFTLKILKDERKFNLEQIKKFNNAIEALEEGILENNKTLENLQKEAKYLVGSNLDEKNKQISEVESDNYNKTESIATAKNNIELVNNNIDALDKSIAAVKDGTYEFNAPITSVQNDLNNQ